MFEPELILARKLSAYYQVKSIQSSLSVKDVDMSKRIVTGIYSTMLFMDSDFDVLMPGSFDKSMGERGPQSNATAKIKHAMFHDLTQLPGKIQLLEEREMEGRTVQYFETKMDQSTLGNDTLIKYQEEVYDNHSFGFQYVNGKLELIERGHNDFERIVAMTLNPEAIEEAGFFWKVDEVNEFEGSTVSFGANELTEFLGVKSKDGVINYDAYALKLNERIDRLNGLMKNGKLSDDGFSILDLEISQIKQIFAETLVKVQQPSPKDTPTKEPSEKDTEAAAERKQVLINLSK